MPPWRWPNSVLSLCCLDVDLFRRTLIIYMAYSHRFYSIYQIITIVSNITMCQLIFLLCAPTSYLNSIPNLTLEMIFLSWNQFIFFKWAILGLFFVYFRLFKQRLQFLQQIYVKKRPSSMWCLDSNSWPSEQESPPITTKPGLPPIINSSLTLIIYCTFN